MYDEESEIFISDGATYAHAWFQMGDPWNWNPDIIRLFPSFKQKLPVWDVLAFLWHRFQLPHPNLCAACKYGYAGHTERLERGRMLVGYGAERLARGRRLIGYAS